jgi:hypothetical protein
VRRRRRAGWHWSMSSASNVPSARCSDDPRSGNALACPARMGST